MKREDPAAMLENGLAARHLTMSAKNGVSGTLASEVYTFRPGLYLVVSETLSESPLKATFDIDDGPVQFGFTCHGKNRCLYNNGEFRSQIHSMAAGSNGIFHLPKTTGIIERPQGEYVCVASIVAAPDFLHSYFRDVLDRMPKRFRHILEGSHHGQFAWFGSNSPAKVGAFSEILHCPYPEEYRALFRESRALEFLAIQIRDFVDSERGKALSPTPLRSDDVERIRAARDRLIADLEHPPSLQELAAAVGINDRKLKTGFRQVFGTSVFGYYREYRMQAAHEILQTGNGNITEAAMAVGYQSLSHFSQAFRKRFGLRPKDFLAKQSRRLRW
ncbi:helix-turn-helix transcriptional regulator [Desulfomonile tiedjei]|uniref:DNA-binding domain-containing protein, AraC-type n=1 Tax=Desulfomonile tiedjei (strain ATCC 49306 / DSM 6799 / DCB-1) TaxID=706587 RepID=I4C0A8_DESTA|nr:AraC family transcriptional regulator [Desulfomonile tiedjei]AFM22999.1 DNA-binding domain-containing protein, AraC-type [Desulfomonile tiedjei DSM 6799]